MVLRKESDYRNDNLKKKDEALNLTKDTKDTQTTTDKILQHSEEQIISSNSSSSTYSNQKPQYNQNTFNDTVNKNHDLNTIQNKTFLNNDNPNFQTQYSSNKLMNSNESFHQDNNFQAQNISADNNSKLQPQLSQRKLIGTNGQHHGTNNKILNNNQNYAISGNTAQKLDPQQSKTKLTNQLLNASSEFIKDSVKNGVNKYRKGLTQGDEGVATADKYIETTTELTKQTKKAIQKVKNRKLKKETLQELKVNKSILQEQIKQDKLDIKETKNNIKEKLKKNTTQLEHAKKELKIKKDNLKEKQADLKLVKKEQSKHNFIKKVAKSPLATTATKRGLSNYKDRLESENEGVEVVGKTASLAKQGIKAIEKAKKIRQHQLNQEKLKSIYTKLANGNKKVALQKGHVRKIQKIDKPQLKKKMIRKKMYAPKYERRRTLTAFTTGIKTGVKNIYTSVKNKISIPVLKGTVGKDVAVGGGALFLKLVPLFIAFVVIFGVLLSLFAGGGGYEEEISRSRNLPPEVEQWRELVTLEAQAQGMGDYVDLILAIIAVESGGKGTDIMQSSESAGLPRNSFDSPEDSVRQGVSYLKNIVNILKSYNRGYENNLKLIAQSYNFGTPFAHYVGDNNLDYSLEVTEKYSRDILAPANGNKTGEKVPYNNPIAEVLGKPYRYKNGGNFLYGEVVAQYFMAVPNDFEGDFSIVMEELLKYEGTPYVWGGKTPQTGFDCSGLVEWGLKQIGINLPSPSVSQYHNSYPIDPSEAKPGDLIFFKGTYGGPNHISHVGFYIDDTTMYDSNSSGVGFTNWKSAYWQKHFAGIRRVIK